MGEKVDGNKNNEGEKKSEDITVVLKFDMHCEGCAKKVRKFVKKFDGVESVKTDCSANKLEIIGKVDPTKMKEKVEEKTKKKVELVSPLPKKPAKEGGGEKKSDDKKPSEKKSEGKSDDKKAEEKPKEKKSEGKSDDKKAEEKPKEKKTKEPPVATVLLKTRVHCEGCAQKIKKIVSRREGVQDVDVDLSKDLITIKGTMNMEQLLPYLDMKLKRTVELVPTKKEEGAGGDKKPKDGAGSSEKPNEGGGDKKEGGGNKKDGGGEKKDAAGGGGGGGGGGSSSQNNTSGMEVNRMGYMYYPYNYGYSYAYYGPMQQQGYGHQGGYYANNQVVDYWHAPHYSHPPQMFSDENPNACSVM